MTSVYDQIARYRPKTRHARMGKSGRGSRGSGGKKFIRRLKGEQADIERAIASVGVELAGAQLSATARDRLLRRQDGLGAQLVHLAARVKAAEQSLAEALTTRGKKRARRRVEDVARAPSDGAPTSIVATEPHCLISSLPVPVPAEHVRAATAAVSRPGQAEFRDKIIAAYRMCAVTKCEVEAVLEAAHIVPYVDERSHIMGNGLCLRADIHALYDRNLIKISESGIISVDISIKCPQYRAVHGCFIEVPVREEDQPFRALLAVRHRFIKEPA